MLQAHYRSTLDFSNEALEAAEKGLKKIINGLRTAKSLSYNTTGTEINRELNTEIEQTCAKVTEEMNNDFNTAAAIAELYALLKWINSFKTGLIETASVSGEVFNKLIRTFTEFTEDVLGLTEDKMIETDSHHALVESMMVLYRKARTNKNFELVDSIRKSFKDMGLVIRDSKTDSVWAYEE
jgi:cysteinyl-tRNA synthetase